MKQTLQGIQVKYDEPILILYDNTSDIIISKNPSNAFQDEVHSNQVSLSTRIGYR
jgi:hypothetical protein